MLLTPNVLECMHFTSKCAKADKRTVTNYEFDLYLDGQHKICLDGTVYPETERCMIFRKPGQITSGTGDYNMFVLTLDFSDEAISENNIYRPVSGKLQRNCEFEELDMIPSVFHPYHFDELKALMEKLASCSYPSVTDKNLQNQYIKEFILLTLCDAARHNRGETENNSTNQHIKSACNFISKHFTENISVRDIATHLHLTENYLIKRFKKELGETPGQYVLKLRLIHSRYLILHSEQTLQEIAFACGFNTPSYFSKRFYAYFGILPGELRKNKD